MDVCAPLAVHVVLTAPSEPLSQQESEREDEHRADDSLQQPQGKAFDQVFHFSSPIAATPAIPSTAQRRMAPAVSLIVFSYGLHWD